jgi:hypothetical protein
LAKQYKYTLYEEDGMTRSWIQNKMELAELQVQVRGDIEMPPRDFWPNLKNARSRVYINETGKLEGMKRNRTFPVTPWGDYLAGPVLVEEVAK